jgi:acyl-CoA synthetase (AMP-forming)/AMP-acid ligase II
MADASVTHASATPTFWRLLVGWLTPQTAQEIPLRQITLGGEAASGSLLERLRDLFPQAKITHIYAGTEFGSAIAVSDGRPGLPESVLEHSDGASVEMRIVAGELQVRSDAGMLGYHGAEDEPSRWHSTGDLVEIRDGRIHFVGRTTEVINVGGAKVHPLPVEEVIAGVAGVVVVSVYGRENPITGNIVAADVVAAPDFREEEIERAIRAACESLPPAARPRRIRFVTEIATQGSKLVRGSGQTP